MFRSLLSPNRLLPAPACPPPPPRRRRGPKLRRACLRAIISENLLSLYYLLRSPGPLLSLFTSQTAGLCALLVDVNQLSNATRLFLLSGRGCRLPRVKMVCVLSAVCGCLIFYFPAKKLPPPPARLKNPCRAASPKRKRSVRVRGQEFHFWSSRRALRRMTMTGGWTSRALQLAVLLVACFAPRASDAGEHRDIAHSHSKAPHSFYFLGYPIFVVEARCFCTSLPLLTLPSPSPQNSLPSVASVTRGQRQFLRPANHLPDAARREHGGCFMCRKAKVQRGRSVVRGGRQLHV